ncbi:glycosyltransferase family 4 protein [Halocatena marina]|uniref:glycosyltransferase family 4 protein n=1 Tax=Halocatena marina TaxID=2934937 RepID=UPI0020106BAA|nr:glycosyltransferase family 1 protein [Halocatena marina]
MTTTNVGVDARTLTGKRSGVGNYLANIIESGAFDGYTVYAYYDPTDGNRSDIVVPDETRFRWRPCRCPSFVDRLFGPIQPIWWVNVTLARLLERDNIDCFFGPNFVQPVAFDGPSAVVVHDMVHRTLPEVHTAAYRLYLRVFLAASLERADQVITVSENTKHDLLRYHQLSDDDVTIAYGAADDVYQPRTVPSETRDRLCRAFDIPEQFALYVGNIEPRKNLASVLDALAVLDADARPPLVIVGQDHLVDEALEKALQRCPFREHVHFTGHVPADELPLLYNMASLFVYPSLYEGFGLPPVEAMQSGTPVIVSDRASLPEVVGEAGLTVDPADTIALSEAVARLWSDAAARSEFEAKGRQRAKRFSWDRTATRISNVLNSLSKRQMCEIGDTTRREER